MTERRDPFDGAPVTQLAIVLTRMAMAEMALARAEVGQSIRRAFLGMALLVVTLVLLLVALNMLAGAAAIGLAAAGIPDPWAPAIVGLTLILIGACLTLWALSALKPSRLIPVRTAARLRRDAELIKEMMRHDPQA